jgi:hypothetical protein
LTNAQISIKKKKIQPKTFQTYKTFKKFPFRKVNKINGLNFGYGHTSQDKQKCKLSHSSKNGRNIFCQQNMITTVQTLEMQ